MAVELDDDFDDLDNCESSSECDRFENELNNNDNEEDISKGHLLSKERPPRKKAKCGNLLKGIKAAEEIRTLTDFETNVITLQINDILSEVAVKEKRRQAALLWFDQLKCALVDAKINKKHVQNLHCPLPQLPDDPQLAEFTFSPPKSVTLVGSFAYETAVRWSAIDMAVEMPSSCFAKCDYHNVKYQRKRAMYLLFLAAALQKNPSLHSRLHWRVIDDDRLPILVVTSPPGTGGLTAHILPYPEAGVFQPSRFAPDKLNVQEKFYKQPANSRKPVTIYNGGVLRDILLMEMKEVMFDQLKTSNGIRGGIQMLKLWLQSKGLSTGPDGFSSFHLTAYVEHLLRSGRLNLIMGVYQVMRAVLTQIQSEDWTSTRLVASSAKETHKLMLDQGAVAILLDRSLNHNIFYTLSTATIDLIRSEARAALQTLNSASVNLVNELCSFPTPFYRKFDCYCRVILGEDSLDVWTRADFGTNSTWPTSRAIMATLRKAFRRRVSLLALRPLPPLEWDVGRELPDVSTVLEIGWNLDPDEEHHIEKGPPADSAEAVEFREFWGDKCEIRRFQDGSILETVLWPGETSDDRRSITANICEYILRRRHRAVTKVTFAGELCDRVLQLPNCHFTQRYGTGDEQLVEINLKFNELAKILRKLPDLPADVTTIHGLCEELCYTAVFPQVAAACDTDARTMTRLEGRCVPRQDGHGFPKLVQPIDILLAVEASKWPDDLNALRHMKTAFYLALAKALEGRECQVFHDHVLFLFHGLVFRLRVSCTKEIVLSRQVVTAEGMIKLVENRTSDLLEFEHTVLPKLVSALHGLHLQHSSFGRACRLAKRWLSSHHLGDAFPWVAVDLMVAYCYIQPLPLSLPHSSRCGFQRFLHLLASFEWRLNPLIVNFNDHFSAEDIQQKNSYFSRNRQSLPPLYICTPFDKKNTSCITADNPIGPVLQRAAVLARKSLVLIETQMAEGLSVLGAFRASLEVYDFVIKLDERFMVTRHFGLNIGGPGEKLTFTKIRDEVPVVDFDPVKLYVDDLRTAYGHLCVFFYDKYGGTDIGGLWTPKAQTPVPFKVHNIAGRKLTEPAMVLTPNYSAILSDFKVLGQGLVKDIVEQRCPTTFSRSRKNSR